MTEREKEKEMPGGGLPSGNKIKVVIVKPGMKPFERYIDRTLESIQSVVGGLIEQVCPFDDCVSLICNEEGKIEGLPPNRALRSEEGEIYDIVAGTFFVAYTPPDSDRFESMPDNLAEKYIDFFRFPEMIFVSDGKLEVIKYEPDAGSEVS